jgi:hypothetical protein
MSHLERVSGFGQSDPTDNRKLLQWESRYPAEARKSINFEAVYLGLLLFLNPLLLLLLSAHAPNLIWSRFDLPIREAVTTYGLAWVAGTLGGTLYALKWLYHVVARGLWNLDRRLWRLFTPHISGGLAFAVIALISSDITRIFDARATNSHALVVGVAFLTGYFSDSAVAKLTDIADTLFGTTRSKEKHDPKTQDQFKSGHHHEGAMPSIEGMGNLEEGAHAE